MTPTVLVSANIQRGYPYFIVDRVFADPNLELCISDELFAEYVEVLNREKFANSTNTQQVVLGQWGERQNIERIAMNHQQLRRTNRAERQNEQ